MILEHLLSILLQVAGVEQPHNPSNLDCQYLKQFSQLIPIKDLFVSVEPQDRARTLFYRLKQLTRARTYPLRQTPGNLFEQL